MAELNINERQAGDVTVLDMSGKITIGEGSVALRTAVRRLLEEGKKRILLNLAGVSYIDSSGIGDDPAPDPNAGDIIEGIAAVGADFFYTSGLGPNSMIGGHVGGEIELNDLLEIAEHALDSSDLLVLVTLVPEPSTLTMLLAGILATFVHRCRAGG